MILLDTIEKAKDYASKRLQAQRNINERIDEILLETAVKIYEICLKYNSPHVVDKKMQKEIDEVLNEAKEKIWQYELAYAKVAEKELKDKKGVTAAYLAAAHFGKTFKQRQNTYMYRFAKDVRKIVLAGFVTNVTSGELEKAVKYEFRQPYLNGGILHQAKVTRGVPAVYNTNYEEAAKKAAEVMESLKTPSYGAGIEPSGYAQIMKNAKDTLALAWSEEEHDVAMRSGAVGFFVHRGSSYPCIDCQSHVGWLHKEGDDFPPFHSHCVCFCTYTTSTEIKEMNE